MSDTYQSDKIFSYLIDSNKMVSQALSQFFKDNQPYMESIAKFQRSYQQVLSSTINMSAINQIAKLYTQPHFQAIQNALQSYQQLQSLTNTAYPLKVSINLLTRTLSTATKQLTIKDFVQNFPERTDGAIDIPFTINIGNNHVIHHNRNHCIPDHHSETDNSKIDQDIFLSQNSKQQEHSNTTQHCNESFQRFIQYITSILQVVKENLLDSKFVGNELTSFILQLMFNIVLAFTTGRINESLFISSFCKIIGALIKSIKD